MTRTHATLISLFLGLAVVLGLFAVVRTTSLASPTSSASAGNIVARQRHLDRVEARLRRALARRPPALATAGRATSVAAPRIRYVRPAPIARPSASFEEHEDEMDEGSDD